MWAAARLAKIGVFKTKEIKKGHFFKLPRKIAFTKFGVRFTILLLVIGIAAINTGNNLMYLIVAMMMSLIIISGVMSESSIRGLKHSRALPMHVFAGMPVNVQWTVKNTKRHFPSFSISLNETSPDISELSGCYLIKINVGVTVEKAGAYIFPRRGIYKLQGFKVSTRFPFGLFLKSKDVDSNMEVLVYPRIKPVKQSRRHTYSIGASADGDAHKASGGGDTQIYNIRDYVTGDDSRLIHWKSSAKANKLMSKEFETEKRKGVIIRVDNIEPEKVYDGFYEEFENMVEDAAALAAHFIKKGFYVGIKTFSGDVPCRTGTMHLYRILRLLALIQPVKPAGGHDAGAGIKIIEL
ncbi:MAG: hypothetical protein A2073_06975 [Deltaproteobacteria bacterium GWC2_42_11]|nr:MAG: hypothetical protein A2073_06975 [Deltaproteobacteria bacterium GWC2_42_11]